MPIEIRSFDELRERLGQELSVSDWVSVAQARIDAFAEATEDRQWIHVEPARAAAESPFHGPIAHGFLTLSLLSALMKRAIAVPRVPMAINYGLNRVRFPAPVRAGSRVRGRFTPLALEPVERGVQLTWKVVVECEGGGEKPCCVAEWLVRYHEQLPG
jgi:acyl dehydratase